MIFIFFVNLNIYDMNILTTNFINLLKKALNEKF